MASVGLEGVRKVYPNGFVAVEGATFEVADGELVVLVGPSGSGKSTLLRMIAGLETISGGRLRIGDREVSEVPPQHRDIAMVFQSYALYPHMTVFDNLAFGLKLRRVAAPEIERRVRSAADMLGIEAILERRPRQLSGGQRQRVAVGRAIVRDPQVFLFDEPLSNLDAKLRVQMRTEIASLHHRLGATMIYVTHDQVEAMTLGERIVVLDGGVIQQIDSPLALYDHPVNRFVAGFIGSPAMNFLAGTLVRAGGLELRVGDGLLRLALPEGAGDLASRVGRELIVGFRPESLSVRRGDAGSTGAGAGGASAGGAGTGDGSPALAELPLTVDVVEPLGNEIFLYAHTGPFRVTARVPPQPLPEPGRPIVLAVDVDRLHFFDADTERALDADRAA